MEPSHPGLEREANVRLATRLKTAVVLVRRIVRRPCRSELRLFLAPPESFCLSNPFAAIAPVKIRARREAASPSYPRAGPRSGPQSDRLLDRQGIDTTTPGGKALFQMMGVFAEFERAMIQERINAGIARARKHGTKSGRPIGRPPIPIRPWLRSMTHGHRARASNGLPVILALALAPFKRRFMLIKPILPR